MQPNLFLIGAPKSGTTSLYTWMGQHEAIFVPRLKEPYFYANPLRERPSREDYLAAYQNGQARYRLDASVWYMHYPQALTEILSDCPEARFILSLRNPLELAPSLHFQKRYDGHELIADFQEAWRLNDKRMAGEFAGITKLSKQGDPRHMAYRNAAMLGQVTQNVMDRVDHDRLFICFLEDISKEPEQVFNRLLAFLDLEPLTGVQFEIANASKRARSKSLRALLRIANQIKPYIGLRKSTGLLSGLHHFNQVKTRYADPSPALLAEMRDAFADDIALLSRLTGRELSHWLEA